MLWSRAPVIVAIVVVAVLAAFGYSALQTDLYRATSKVRVVDPNSEAVFDGVQIRTDPKRDVDTQLSLMRSEDLRADVEQALGGQASSIDRVSMSGVGSTDLIAITVSSRSPEVAAAAANAFAEVYVQQRKDQVSSSFTERADALREQSAQLQQQIADIDAQLETDPRPSEGAVLEARREQLGAQQANLEIRATQFDVEAAARTGNVEVAETAVPPSKPYYPTPARNAAIAGILALFVGVGLALILDRLDDRIHNSDDAEAVAGGVPVIGVIPIDTIGGRRVRRLSRSAARHLVQLDSSAAEAFRALRSNLRFSAVDTKRKTILVTSSDSGEGKSTVVANLAVVLAESGLRVVMISADLRRPSLASFYGVSETSSGLTSVLVGDATIAEVLVPVPLASGRSVYVMPAGPLPQNPAELLGSSAMQGLIDSLERAGADFILVDSAPILPVADALALAQVVDGVLVLSMAGRTPRGHLRETLARLRKVDAELIGIILDGVPTRGRYSRTYGGYTYGYQNSHSAAASGDGRPPTNPMDGGFGPGSNGLWESRTAEAPSESPSAVSRAE